MTKLLEHAVEAARSLSPDRQDQIARLVLAYAESEQPVYEFSAEENAELDEAEAAAARGDFATDEEVRALWAKYGL